jgi:hypothetical protein
MAQRSWWVAAGAGVAVAALIGVAVLVSTGAPEGDSVGTGTASTGAAGDGTSGAPGSAASSPDQSPPSAQPSSPRQQPSLVAPRSQVLRPDLPVALSIQSYELLSPDRVQVRYATGLPRCHGTLGQAIVDESGERVRVTLGVEPVRKPSGAPCPEVAMVKDTVVRLGAALGDRPLVDGATGRVVSRGHGRS